MHRRPVANDGPASTSSVRACFSRPTPASERVVATGSSSIVSPAARLRVRCGSGRRRRLACPGVTIGVLRRRERCRALVAPPLVMSLIAAMSGRALRRAGLRCVRRRDRLVSTLPMYERIAGVEDSSCRRAPVTSSASARSLVLAILAEARLAGTALEPASSPAKRPVLDAVGPGVGRTPPRSRRPSRVAGLAGGSVHCGLDRSPRSTVRCRARRRVAPLGCRRPAHSADRRRPLPNDRARRLTRSACSSRCSCSSACRALVCAYVGALRTSRGGPAAVWPRSIGARQQPPGASDAVAAGALDSGPRPVARSALASHRRGAAPAPRRVRPSARSL